MREFYIRRFLRIAPLFYFMMISYYPFFWMLGGKAFPLSQFVSSALFIFNFVPQHVAGFVMASWSIGVEMALYAILPLLVFAIIGLARSLMFLAVAVFLAANWAFAFQGTKGALVLFSQLSLIAHLLHFAAGIAGYYAWLGLRRSSHQVGRLILVASLLTIVGLIGFANQIAASFGTILNQAAVSGVNAVWAVTLAGAVVGVSLYPHRWFDNPAAKLLGSASFSIYLWHPVVIVILDRSGLYRAIYASFDGASMPFFASLIATFATLKLSLHRAARHGFGGSLRPSPASSTRLFRSRTFITSVYRCRCIDLGKAPTHRYAFEWIPLD
ncbi:acyltransferase [Mesorhizobium sp.]|uniref:acyltransferase family protein n=1 Tax=Mesorhizobium sp. TaxID=1871066 RepID=UPI0025BB6B7E|nr:acyltransferase [Mesorhizobium sp.]